MHTGQLEGINNKIKVIKRMAYGYRDIDYFFLKIKAAFKCAMNLFCPSVFCPRASLCPLKSMPAPAHP